MTTDLIAIGAALVDTLARTNESFLSEYGYTKGHMHLIDAGQAEILEDQLRHPQLVSGGSAANTCLGFASFGGSAAFMGCVKMDWAGEFFASDLGQAGVLYLQLPTDSAAATGRCYCLVTPDGERTMCTHLGISGDFDAAAADPGLVAGARLLFVEGYTWNMAGPAAATDILLRAMKAQGGQVALTLSDGWVADAHRDTFLSYCREGLVDVLFGNEAEITTLLQATDFDSALPGAAGLARTVALTRSAKGAVVLQGGTITTIPAMPVDKVVDATGAGDQFAAGFLFGYLNGADMATAGQLGVLAATEVIGHLGARPQTALQDLAHAAGFALAAQN